MPCHITSLTRVKLNSLLDGFHTHHPNVEGGGSRGEPANVYCGACTVLLLAGLHAEGILCLLVV